MHSDPASVRFPIILRAQRLTNRAVRPAPTSRTMYALEPWEEVRQLKDRIAHLEFQHRLHHRDCTRCSNPGRQAEESKLIWKHHQPVIASKTVRPEVPPWQHQADALIVHLTTNLKHWTKGTLQTDRRDVSSILLFNEAPTHASSSSAASLTLRSSKPAKGLAAHSETYKTRKASNEVWAECSWAIQYAGLLACAVEFERHRPAFYEAMPRYVSRGKTEQYFLQNKRMAQWVYRLLWELEGDWKAPVFMVLFVPGKCQPQSSLTVDRSQ